MNQFKNQTKFDINDIIKILPHRYPFILIDKIEILGDLDRISKWGNRGYSFKWSRQWNSRFYNTLNLSYSEYYNYQDDSYFVEANITDLDSNIFNLNIILDQDNTVEDFTARYDAEILSGKNNKFEFGLSFTYAKVQCHLSLFLYDIYTSMYLVPLIIEPPVLT